VTPENSPAISGSHEGSGAGHMASRLGPLLCWAIVFADIGTSVYYVPGILYRQVGAAAGLFVSLTMIVFVLLALKYAEVSARFPEGGGVVTVASRGINAWAGAVGGMFILVDYFLTSAISSLSGLIYFETVIPRIAPYVLFITLVVMALLGVLNWYGIKESAGVSMVIASIAFISDILILFFVFIHVPPGTVLAIFRDMFTSAPLTPVSLLVGFAGAFLAFSGLESISQLSPVMRLPRRKTVRAALTIVVLTVAITSPLLTLFSTTLLTDPRYAPLLRFPAYGVKANPDQFISLLAGAFGGQWLEILVAITASALLIFAANTAIIGAYHVFLALSRLRFFPEVVERTSKLRGTPVISIVLATVIPMAILVAVQAHLDVLGDLYAFGLLGAFSLTCISLDIIRWRERRGAPHVGALIDPELVRGDGRILAPPTYPSPVADAVRRVLGGERIGRLDAARVRVRQQISPATREFRRAWPTITYYLGFLTTFLVMIAWVTNLFAKPHATIFGGAVTLIGVAISAWHFRYQSERRPVVFLDHVEYVPDSQLVVLSPLGAHNREVINAAVTGADVATLVFLYLAPTRPQEAPPRLFEIRDRFGLDKVAQDTLSIAKRTAIRANAPARYLYAVGGAQQIFDIASRVRPEEIIAEAAVAKELTQAARSNSRLMIAPEYVRYELLNGVKIAHNHLHDIYAQGAEETAREQGARSPSLVPTPPLANSRASSNGAGGARSGRSAPPGASPPDRTHPTDKP
jgi:amino acid transporter